MGVGNSDSDQTHVAVLVIRSHLPLDRPIRDSTTVAINVRDQQKDRFPYPLSR
jgi:hypothetical protein